MRSRGGRSNGAGVQSSQLTLRLFGGTISETKYTATFNGSGEFNRHIDKYSWNERGSSTTESIVHDPDEGEGNNHWIRGPTPIQITVDAGSRLQVYDADTGEHLGTVKSETVTFGGEQSPDDGGEEPDDGGFVTRDRIVLGGGLAAGIAAVVVTGWD